MWFFHQKCGTGCLGGEVCKGQGGLSVCNSQGISAELQGKTPAWLRRGHQGVHWAKAWQACVGCMIVLTSSNGRQLLLIGLVPWPLCELHVQPLPAEPSLRSDFTPCTMQVTGSEADKLAKHSVSEQHFLPQVQKDK